jgi:hypothetical protein
MPTPRKPTFADIVSEVRATPAAAVDVTAGRFSRAGQFFDPEGMLLTKTRSAISPTESVELLATGALVAFEGCGCGGFTGCDVTWLPPESLRQSGSPRFVTGFGSPTWIDVWTSDSSTVVFLHGDVKWGDAL